MADGRVWLSVAVIALVTALLRFLPFLIWRGDKPVPAAIEKLGRLLPYAIMGMLVVYCLKEVHFAQPAGWVPQAAASLVVGVLYLWRRNTLLSIIAGTLCHMLLVQWVF